MKYINCADKLYVDPDNNGDDDEDIYFPLAE
jgi:hypothetical protein